MISFDLLIRTKNPQNGRHGNWKAEFGRRNAQKAAVLRKMPALPKLEANVVVTFTRYSPNTMDDDGLRASLKSVRDAVCARLRIDDGSPLIAFRYVQAKGRRGEPKVTVQIEGLRERGLANVIAQIPPEFRRVTTVVGEVDDELVELVPPAPYEPPRKRVVIPTPNVIRHK